MNPISSNRPLNGQTVPNVPENYVIGSNVPGAGSEYFENIKPASEALFDAHSKNNMFKIPDLKHLIRSVTHVLTKLPSTSKLTAKIAQLNIVMQDRVKLNNHKLSMLEILARAYSIDAATGGLILNPYNTFKANMIQVPESVPVFTVKKFTFNNNVIKFYSYDPSTEQMTRQNLNLVINFQDVPASEFIDQLLLQHILWFDFPYQIPSLNNVNIKTAYDQGGYQSCTANAAAFLYHYAEVVENNFYIFAPSRMYIWFNAIYMGDNAMPPRATITYGNGGTSTTRAVLSTLKSNYGACREITYPYVGNTIDGAGGIKHLYDTDAKLGVSFAVTTVNHSVSDIKAVLLTQQRPLSMAFNVYNSGFYDGSTAQNGELHLPVVVDKKGENAKIGYNFTYTGKNEKNEDVQKSDIAGSHAVVICGFDDAKTFNKLNYTAGPVISDAESGYYKETYAGISNGSHVTDHFEPYTGAFLVRNSWGNWGTDGVEANGNAGYFWMPYVFFNGTNPQNSSDNTPTTGEFLFLDPSIVGNRGKSISNPCQSCYTTTPCGFTFC